MVVLMGDNGKGQKEEKERDMERKTSRLKVPSRWIWNEG